MDLWNRNDGYGLRWLGSWGGPLSPTGREPFFAGALPPSPSSAFPTVDPPAQVPPLDLPALQSRYARVSPEFLGQLAGLVPVREAPPLALNLLVGADYRAVCDLRRPTLGGGVVWTGTLDGVDGGWWVLAARGPVIAATVFDPTRGRFQIRYVGEGVHRIFLQDPSARFKCGTEGPGEPAVPEAYDNPEGFPPVVPQDTSGMCPDAENLKVNQVLILYTPTARTYAGGTPGILTVIDLAMGVLNLALHNSQVGLEDRLVYCAETPYSDSGNLPLDLGDSPPTATAMWTRCSA